MFRFKKMKSFYQKLLLFAVSIFCGFFLLLWNMSPTDRELNDTPYVVQYHETDDGLRVQSEKTIREVVVEFGDGDIKNITPVHKPHISNVFNNQSSKNILNEITTCDNCNFSQQIRERLATVQLDTTRDITFVLQGPDTLFNFALNSISDKLDVAYSLFVNNAETSNYRNHNMNATVSRSTALNRTVSDTRNTKCQAKYTTSTSHRNSSDQSVSIIIPFHNEEYSIFLRALHSIYSTTPKELLHEVILVDDSCTFTNLQHPFERYVQYFPRLKLYRTRQRQGLIRTRQLGAMVASGNVLVFLDAHVECQKHWLEPLLDVLAEKPTAVAVPAIDMIDPQTLMYRSWSRNQYGTFSWELDYVWKDIPSAEIPDDITNTIPSPTMIGCALAITRWNFHSLGGYDEDMWIWGGENLELSFRSWMCSGGIHLVPCSHIGHLFRSHLPYSFPTTSTVINKNLQRVADIWLGHYKQHYYRTSQKCVPFSEAEKITLIKRKEFIGSLRCQSFDWYLKNIAKGVNAPDNNSMLFGQMKSIATNACLTYNNSSNYELLRLLDCPYVDPLQIFSNSKDNQLIHHHTKLCVEHFTSSVGQNIRMSPCNSSSSKQTWAFDPIKLQKSRLQLRGVDIRKPVGMFRLKHGGFTMCLTVVIKGNDKTPYQGLNVELCDVEHYSQLWLFTHSLNWSLLCPQL